MADETKDTSPQGDESHDAKQSTVETVGADVPEKAGALPPEAGSRAPVEEFEAKIKEEAAAENTLKPEAKIEAALPGVEKPSLTPTVEGGTEKPAPPKPAPPKAAPAAGHKPAAPAKK